MEIHPSQITLRDFCEHDITHVVEYWYRSPRNFIESRGVDIAKLPPEEKFFDAHRAVIERNKDANPSKMTSLTLELSGKPIGLHLVNAVEEGKKADFHAHIWFEEYRGKGIAFHSYLKAFQVFFDRFSLQEIHLNTPISNVAGNRAIDKIGIPVIDKVELHGTILRDGTLANHRIVTRELLNKMLHNSRDHQTI